jgi:hypothetical protein
MDTYQLLNTIFNFFMALGAILIFVQICLSKKQSREQFEDSLNKEYRKIIHNIPLNILFGKILSDSNVENSLDDFLEYFDLCNEQAFLRKQKRISESTWCFWVDGIKSNFLRPTFMQAWEIIKTKAPNDFNELRKLEQSDFSDDPANWN